MKWINFLHIYQPRNQYPEILDAVVSQSYRPILSMINDRDTFRLTMNVSGALLEALDKSGYSDIIDLLRSVVAANKVELTSTAKYHAFMPLLPDDEIYRQIDINNECIRYYLGNQTRLDGFFPPEMGYSEKVGAIINELGYKWIMLDEISAVPAGFMEFPGTNIPIIKNTNVAAILRNRRMSNLIMSALVRTPSELLRIMGAEAVDRKFIVTGMDGETFGHHRPGLVEVLAEISSNKEHPVTFVSELLADSSIPQNTEIVLYESTWASSPQDIEKGVQFLSWDDPENEIHALQWELQHYADSLVNALDKNDPQYNEGRELLDVALASDHFWWASAKPWWGLEMIEDGAYRLYEVVKKVKGLDSVEEKRARDLYYRIIATAFTWQRTGIIRKRREDEQRVRIPFVDRTLNKGGEHIGIYQAFMDLMKENELNTAKNREYEQAIMWRDSQIKIETKNDIYDAVHAVDLIRQKMPFDIVEKLLDKYTEPYKRIRGGQPEQRGS